MKAISMLLAAAALASCGDNIKPATGGDAGHGSDGGTVLPGAPTIGTQIDRLGRPAINTALDHGFDGSASTAGAAKDAYNADASPGGWSQYAAEFAKNLAILDALDGVCGNQVLYNGMIGGGGTAAAGSYTTLASILADDELYLDTKLGTSDIAGSHANYLSVELEVASQGALVHTTCGGRAPANDVMAASYSALAIGVNGFSTDGKFTPLLSDGATAHTDLTANFPFLGAPH
jgi:hypothetical protein